MFNELALFITDNKIQSFSQGTSGGVEFDFFCAWELWKKQKFDKLIMFILTQMDLRECRQQI